MINVSLHQDANLTDTVKYRAAFSGTQLWSGTVVNVGNFSNANIFVDNSVELACGLTTPPTAAYDLAIQCNFIKLVYNAYTIIGAITDWEYINDSNVNISYRVDAFTSAISSGLITSAVGLAERVTMQTTSAFSNLLSEPFSPSDVTRPNPTLTANLNSLVEGFEGLPATPNGVTDSNTRLVLTVSPAVIEYLGVAPFGNPGSGFARELKEVDTLDFYHGDTTTHAGSIFKGTPLVFNNVTQLKDFLSQLLGGCGFRCVMAANGYSTQEAETHRQYITNANTGGGQVVTENKNEDGDPMEAIRFITASDIYNLYCLPANFAVPSGAYPYDVGVVTGFKNLSNLHPWGTENAMKSKLQAYPYYYVNIVTANGDSVDIIPQSHYINSGSSSADWQVGIVLRFIGGDTPRMMGRFYLNGNQTDDSFSPRAACDWFTIRSYPSITLSINDSYNPQVQKDVANARKTSAVRTNSRVGSQVSNPIKQAYLDTVKGETNNRNSAQGGLARLGSNLGQAFGSIQNALNDPLPVVSDNAELAAWNERRTAEAGNFISSDTNFVMGNDFLSQYGIPAMAAYDRGATDSEMFAFSRFLEEFGTSANCRINPLANSGNLFGGTNSITTFNSQTFFQFSNIQITGNMPADWKNQIKQLFESGVYLR